MPVLKKYLSGFLMKEGGKLAGFLLEKATGSHKTITRYRKYEYPIVLTYVRLAGTSTSAQLLAEVKKLTKSKRTIYTRYGNPYSCHFGTPYIAEEKDNQVIIKTTGGCTRIFN